MVISKLRLASYTKNSLSLYLGFSWLYKYQNWKLDGFQSAQGSLRLPKSVDYASSSNSKILSAIKNCNVQYCS